MNNIIQATNKQGVGKKKRTKVGPMDTKFRIALHDREISRLKQNEIRERKNMRNN
jgi:hypothetical protein